MRITIPKKVVIFLKIIWMGLKIFFWYISKFHWLPPSNGSLKLNLIKLFLLFLITHIGGTPLPQIPLFLHTISTPRKYDLDMT